MAGALVVPMPVLVERVNLHWPWDVSQCVAGGSRKRPCWSGWEGDLGKTGADVGGCPGVEGTPALPLLTLEPIHCPGVAVCLWRLSATKESMSAHGVDPPVVVADPLQGDQHRGEARILSTPGWQIGSRAGNGKARVPPLLGIIQRWLQPSPDLLPSHSRRAFS